MKRLLLAGLTMSCLLFVPLSALGSGYYPCCMQLKLDKVEYLPGEKVLISVIGTDDYANSTDSVSIKITDVTYGPDFSKVVYQDAKTLANGKASFEFNTPPADSDRYRYLVSMTGPAVVTPTFFFTKKDASRTVISDARILTPKVMQGGELQFEAKIVDGVGKPFHYLTVLALSDVPQVQDCEEQANIYKDASPLRSVQERYWSDGIINGTIPVSYTARPGKYNLTLQTGSDYDGYSTARTTIPFEIVSNQIKPKPYALFKPFTINFTKDFLTNQSISVTGYTAYNSCGEIVPHVPVSAQIVEYDIVTIKKLGVFQRQETISDENGRFSFQFKPLGTRPGYFSVQFITTYDGVESEPAGAEMPHNMKNYSVFAEGKEFIVPVDSWYSIPQNLHFSKEQKKIELDVDTSDTFRRIEIRVPHELLDGDFFQVLVNGKDIGQVYSKIENYTIFNFDSSYAKTHVEIIGTSVVPEFGPLVLIMITISSAIVIATLRLRYSKTSSQRLKSSSQHS